MRVTQDRLCLLAITRRTGAFFWSVFVNGKTGRVDPNFDKVPHANVFLQDRMRYLETLAVFGVHGDAIDQLVAVGQSLLIELSFKVSTMIFHLSSPFAARIFLSDSTPSASCRIESLMIKSRLSGYLSEVLNAFRHQRMIDRHYQP